MGNHSPFLLSAAPYSNSMLATIAPIFPIFLVIAFGYWLRRSFFTSQEFWSTGDRFIYFILLPALFFDMTAHATFEAGETLKVALIAGLSILTLTALLLAVRPLLPVDAPGFTSLYQGAVRFNSYVAVSAAVGLFGALGATTMAITISFMVPLLNILCVIILTRYGARRMPNWKNILQRIASNPLILSCVLGVLVNYSGLEIPTILDDVLKIMGRAALPFGLLAVGAGLHLTSLHRSRLPIFCSSIAKLLVLPALTAGWGLAFGMKEETLLIGVLFASMPGATSSYILARQLGGDVQLMSGIIVAETLLAILTMPFVLLIAQYWLS